MNESITILTRPDEFSPSFKGYDEGKYDDPTPHFDGSAVDAAREKAEQIAKEFIEKLSELGTVITSIKDAGIQSTNLDSNIAGFKGLMGQCSQEINDITVNIKNIVMARLAQMNDAEQSAYRVASSTTAFSSSNVGGPSSIGGSPSAGGPASSGSNNPSRGSFPTSSNSPWNSIMPTTGGNAGGYANAAPTTSSSNPNTSSQIVGYSRNTDGTYTNAETGQVVPASYVVPKEQKIAAPTTSSNNSNPLNGAIGYIKNEDGTYTHTVTGQTVSASALESAFGLTNPSSTGSNAAY